MRPPPAAQADLDRSWADFTSLVRRARREERRGRLEQAAVAARVAATYGWFNHPGVFASAELEAVVRDLGRAVAAAPADPPTRAPSLLDGGVLHVATEVYGTGGHTQMLANWIRSDAGTVHHVCLTGQRGRALPDKLVGAMGASGRVVALDDSVDGLLGRARALRALAASAEAVVLHVHPDDVVPGIAFAGGDRTVPVLAVNHADHVFWVGVTVPDVVVHLRASGAELSRTRRGVAPGRSDTLVRPLVLEPRRVSRARARERLGVPEERLLVVTAAAASKYDAVDGRGFLDLVLPVLRDRGDTTLLAAGPDPTGRWADLEGLGLGRALGLLPDVRPLLEAADVYLDSYPFSSLTSLLEAAGLGVPVLTLRPGSDEPAVLSADTPELEGVMRVAGTAADLRASLAELLDGAAARDDLGSRTRAAVEAAHADGAWPRAARRVLADAAAAAGPPHGSPRPPDVRRTGRLDHRVALLQAQSGWGQGVTGSLVLNAGLLPVHRRWVVAARLVAAGGRPSAADLVSTGTARRLRALRARVRRLRGRGATGSERVG